MTSPFLTRPGAVAGDPPDDGLPAHYGDPLREQRSLAERVGWIDRSNRGVLRITGADRLSWLHSLTSQHVESLPAGTGGESLVLSPNGHVEHHLVLAEDGDALWLDVEAASREPLQAFLDSMRFTMRVEVEDATDARALVSVVGPDVDAAVARVATVPGRTPYDVTMTGDVLARRMPWPGEDAVDLLVPRSQLSSVVESLEGEGATAAGMWAFEAFRVAAKRPRLFLDTDHRTLPHEVGWIETAVHLSKGCYRGQETVARVHNLGRPPRRMVLLHLDGSAERLPARGAAITLDGSDVGVVGTAVRHYELGPLALGLVRRSTPVDVDVQAEGIPARPEVIVDPEAGLHIKPALR